MSKKHKLNIDEILEIIIPLIKFNQEEPLKSFLQNNFVDFSQKVNNGDFLKSYLLSLSKKYKCNDGLYNLIKKESSKNALNNIKNKLKKYKLFNNKEFIKDNLKIIEKIKDKDVEKILILGLNYNSKILLDELIYQIESQCDNKMINNLYTAITVFINKTDYYDLYKDIKEKIINKNDNNLINNILNKAIFNCNKDVISDFYSYLKIDKNDDGIKSYSKEKMILSGKLVGYGNLSKSYYGDFLNKNNTKGVSDFYLKNMIIDLSELRFFNEKKYIFNKKNKLIISTLVSLNYYLNKYHYEYNNQDKYLRKIIDRNFLPNAFKIINKTINFYKDKHLLDDSTKEDILDVLLDSNCNNYSKENMKLYEEIIDNVFKDNVNTFVFNISKDFIYKINKDNFPIFVLLAEKNVFNLEQKINNKTEKNVYELIKFKMKKVKNSDKYKTKFENIYLNSVLNKSINMENKKKSKVKLM